MDGIDVKASCFVKTQTNAFLIFLIPGKHINDPRLVDILVC